MNLENCILTFSGYYVNLADPDPATINITDIAHALSQINRFGGHTRRFYSVAQHCVLASQVAPLKYRLQTLLHDAAEAYLGDMVQPLKSMAGQGSYRDIVDVMQARIFHRFGLGILQSDECHACIRHADLTMLATERRDLMPPDAHRWAVLDGIAPRVATINPVGPQAAEAIFLHRYKELTGVQ